MHGDRRSAPFSPLPAVQVIACWMPNLEWPKYRNGPQYVMVTPPVVRRDYSTCSVALGSALAILGSLDCYCHHRREILVESTNPEYLADLRADIRKFHVQAKLPGKPIEQYELADHCRRHEFDFSKIDNHLLAGRRSAPADIQESHAGLSHLWMIAEPGIRQEYDEAVRGLAKT